MRGRPYGIAAPTDLGGLWRGAVRHLQRVDPQKAPPACDAVAERARHGQTWHPYVAQPHAQRPYVLAIIPVYPACHI